MANDNGHVDLKAWMGWISSTADIPKLETLYSGLTGSGPVLERDLPPGQREAATGWAKLFQCAAQRCKLSLVGFEMALLADSRRQSSTATTDFTSFVTMFSAEDQALHEAYADCINRGPASRAKEKAYGYQLPIVLHSDLYSPETGYFIKKIGGAPHPTAADSSVRPAGKVRGYSFSLPRQKRTDPNKSVPQQLDDVVDILRRGAEARDVGHEVQGGALVLLPFARPEFAISATVRAASKLQATPGGCVFFIFCDGDERLNLRLPDFLRSVRWVLAEASAAESQTAYEAEIRRRDFAAAMLHGTVSAIRAIGVSALVDLLVDGDAHPKRFTADDLLHDFKGDPLTVARHKARLVSRLQRMLLAENVASSLVGFAEMHAAQGVVRHKFQAEAPWLLRRTINNVWHLARDEERQRATLIPGPDDDATSDWEFPSGYLSDELVTGLIMELFRNAIDHGLATTQDGTGIELSIYGVNDGVVVQIENALPSAGEERAPNLTGFLSRVKLLLKEIRGLDLNTFRSDDRGRFIAQLRLGEITTSRNGESGYAQDTFLPSRPQRRERRP